jgi:uncharacterized zinc-type alcohol dehydrogenase-like protein
MQQTQAWGTTGLGKPLAPMTIERREPGAHDVVIEILFCGVCHSDIHQSRDEWANAKFPMVPGHEIIGRVTGVGPEVSKFTEGDLAGVGCIVDSCRVCSSCVENQQQYCEKGPALTYNSTEMDRTTPTLGGYSGDIVVDENYTLRIPAGLDPAATAPLLCAGITTYSPLRQWGLQGGRPGRRRWARRTGPRSREDGCVHGGQGGCPQQLDG